MNCNRTPDGGFACGRSIRRTSATGTVLEGKQTCPVCLVLVDLGTLDEHMREAHRLIRG